MYGLHSELLSPSIHSLGKIDYLEFDGAKSKFYMLEEHLDDQFGILH